MMIWLSLIVLLLRLLTALCCLLLYRYYYCSFFNELRNTCLSLLLDENKSSILNSNFLLPSSFYYFSPKQLVRLLFGRRPNRVIKFACFDSKLQWARNTCERKQLFKSSKATRMSAARCVTTQHLCALQYVPQLTHANKSAIENKRIEKARYTEWKKLLNNLNFPFWKLLSSQHTAWMFLPRTIGTGHCPFSLYRLFSAGNALYQECDNIFALSFWELIKMSRKLLRSFMRQIRVTLNEV